MKKFNEFMNEAVLDSTPTLIELQDDAGSTLTFGYDKKLKEINVDLDDKDEISQFTLKIKDVKALGKWINSL